MSQAGDILRKAADYAVARWVPRMPEPEQGETCAVTAIQFTATGDPWNGEGETFLAKESLKIHTGEWHLPDWSDTQVSGAVVAAEMRGAADLADLIFQDTDASN